ncbi:MAG: urea ABC transporter permease subunit UrtB [Chloroflexota bacterium]|nr:MAG: urea ABC transporter permease subunit UrtB [Chloroflexota bacterium]
MIETLNAVYASLFLLLVAFGLAIIFGLMGVVNLAHGEFLMLGAYAALVTSNVLGQFWPSLIIAPLLAGAVALVVERGLIRHLYRRPLETILATWGLSIVLRQLVRAIAGPDFRNVPSPTPGAISLFGVDYPRYRLVVIIIVLLVFAGLYIIQRTTSLGLIVRAVIQNPELAATLGINVNRVYQATFVVGSGLAGIAGALLSPTVNVFPEMGPPFVISAFLVVLVGGLGSLPGLVVASLLLGTVQSLVSQYENEVAGTVALLVIAVLALRFLPEGLTRRLAN